jgi:ABC-type transport system involved in multi-copper enzyme maturation permease subunit
MGKIIAIALNTFRESIRDRIFYSLLAFAILMLGSSVILGYLTIGDSLKIIKDFGLSSIAIFGTLIAVFVGIGLVYKEMEKRTIYLILSKPVDRRQFLLGKYCGLSLTLMVEVLVMTIGLFVLCYFNKPEIPWELLYAIIPIIFELQLILAVALFFSTFASPFLSGLFTLSLFIVGHSSSDLKVLVENSDNVVLKGVCNILYYALPNFENLNFKARVVHHLPISLNEIGFSLLYASVFISLILILAILIFQHRDIS